MKANERLARLNKLKDVLVDRLPQLRLALVADLSKNYLETDLAEAATVLSELNEAIAGLKRWMSKPLASYIYSYDEREIARLRDEVPAGGIGESGRAVITANSASKHSPTSARCLGPDGLIHSACSARRIRTRTRPECLGS